MTEPIWVLRSVIEAVHEAQLAEHGGVSGLRDAALLDSALARPLKLHAYGQGDICMLAAAYASGIVATIPSSTETNGRGFWRPMSSCV